MNDTTGKTASSLAIVEKRPHRSGGCVGIFFQLFDWNRKFAKKKLFSKKLLPPARPNQAPRKFCGDEKLPKLRLIANENSGGFPNVKKNGTCNDDPNQKPGMRPPGLVARLMGLESMPAIQQDKSKKATLFETGCDRGGKSVSSHSGFDEDDPNLEKGRAKHELRPQKLQKTGPFERQPLSRFGAEALQFRSVLSRSRKHHPKLASPVKSPRMTSGRNASRLIDAAARILEPGLQATNRAKCALTYSSTIHHTPNDEVIKEETMARSPGLPKYSNYHVTTAKPLKGQSCKNCGSLLDDGDPCANLEEQPLPLASSVSNYVNYSFQVLERSKPRRAISALEQEKERASERNQKQSVPLNSQARNNVRTCAEAIANRKPLNREDQVQWHWTSQQHKPQKDVPYSIAFKHNTQRQNHVSLGRDTVPLRSNLCDLYANRISSAANAINETQDFVALNRSLRSRTQSMMPVKVDNCKFDAERKSCNKRDGSLSPVRKRRSVNVNQQGGSSGFVNSTFTKQRNVKRDAMTGRDMGVDAHSVNRTCSRSTKAHLGDSDRTSGNKDSDVISFTFNSPMKQKTEHGITHKSIQKFSILDKSDKKISSEKSFPLSGDAMGALLEQKLKELTCQEEDELTAGGTRPKRTTAMILQELISALTAERPVSNDDVAVGSNEEKFSCLGGHLLNTKLILQAKEKTVGASLGCSRDSDHLSPGSVLEASFSNSCLSSIVDDSSVANLHPDSVDFSYDGLQPLEPDAELLDSATSLSQGRNGLQWVTDLLSHVSEVLHSFSFADTGSKLAHAEEVILNTELIFRNAALQNSNEIKDFSLSQFLIYELETLASVLWADFGHVLSVEGTKDRNQLKEFLFDCVIEYMDSRYGLYGKSGFKAWSRMQLCMTADELITHVVEEVRRWTRSAGKIPDEIIEREMSHSLGKWTEFEIEEYETGAEIERDLLQILVDEIVIDLCQGKLGSSGIGS